MAVEQLSEQRERAKLEELYSRYEKNEISDKELSELPPYGVIVQTLVIRDLAGITLEHMGK